MRLENATREELAELVDPEFVLSMGSKYGISSLELDDRQGPARPDYARISHGLCGGLYLSLNPRTDRKAAAKELSKRTGLRIRPEEVFYYAIFHECGHTPAVAGDFSVMHLQARIFFLHQIYPPTGKLMTEEQIRRDRIEADKRADQWAKSEFKKWRRARKRLAEAEKPETVSLLMR
jgi:hypothetical protein